MEKRGSPSKCDYCPDILFGFGHIGMPVSVSKSRCSIREHREEIAHRSHKCTTQQRMLSDWSVVLNMDLPEDRHTAMAGDGMFASFLSKSRRQPSEPPNQTISAESSRLDRFAVLLFGYINQAPACCRRPSADLQREPQGGMRRKPD